MIMLIFLFILFSCTSAFTYPHVNMKLNRNSIQVATMNDITLMKTTDDKNDANQSAFSRITKLLEEADKDDKKKPPIYEPNSYPTHVISALAYLIPIVDASDVGKYMFEAYPSVSQVYNTAFGPLTSVYNGIPFLPFVIYFGMSYICRAPTFPVEVRFHFAQAFMLSIIQFLPVLGLGLLEKAGVPGLGIFYNTLFLWVMFSSVIMQGMLLNPLSSVKNPFLVNIVGWSLKYMNYTPDLAPK